MHIVDRGLRFVRGFLQSYGPSSLKKNLWDKDFSEGKWDFIDDTASDCVYPHLEKYSKGGDILDLGCGPGNTACEMAINSYRTYAGVDISDAALAKARKRTEETGRAAKNTFAQGDFLSYQPTQQFDVILFRESMYHVPMGKVKPILEKYSKYLKEGGVFIVRMYTVKDGKRKYRPNAMIGVIEGAFEVVGKTEYADTGSTVITFRPGAPNREN